MTVENTQKALFINKLIETFPDISKTSEVSRQQINDVMNILDIETFPQYLMKNKVSRGLYKIDLPLFAEFDNSISPISIPHADHPQTNNNINYTMDISKLIPVYDPNFIPFGNYNDLYQIIKEDLFCPVYIYGVTGVGKSTMVEQSCHKLKKPLITINFNKDTDEDQLIGSKTLVNGNVEIVDGPVVIAMRNGVTLLLNEIDAGQAGVLMCLFPILEGKPFYFKLKNEIVYPAPGFNVIATANTKGRGSDDGKYIGTNIQNEAFLDRFIIVFEQEFPTNKQEKNILMNIMKSLECVDEVFADTLVKWATIIRKTAEDDAIDDVINTRRLVYTVRTFKIFRDKKKAVELCCNRFDSITKESLIETYNKVAPDVGFTTTQRKDDTVKIENEFD